MEKTNTIIIIALIAVIAVLCSVVALNIHHEETKPVELFKNGTTVEVPVSAELTNQSELGNTYKTAKNTTVSGFDNSGLVGGLASGILSKTITDKGEMQDNGLYKLEKTDVMEIADQLGSEYDRDNVKEVFVAIKHNNTVNQSVYITGSDEAEITSIVDSITWKKGNTVINATMVSSESTPTESADKTYPFYADDGSIMGYYHVGDVVEHYDGLYQLQSDGEWKYIGEAKGSSQSAYEQGYSDALDESDSDDYEYGDYEDYEYSDDYEYGDESADY